MVPPLPESGPQTLTRVGGAAQSGVRIDQDDIQIALAGFIASMKSESGLRTSPCSSVSKW